jgi:hypothetical protein
LETGLSAWENEFPMSGNEKKQVGCHLPAILGDQKATVGRF